MNEQEAQRMVETATTRAVKNLRTAQRTAREAISALALPQAAKERIVEAQTNDIPTLENGDVDVAKLTERTKEAAATEAEYARTTYGYGSGEVQNGATEPIVPNTQRTTEARRAASDLSFAISRLGE